jgi:hypothetical protein
MAHQGGVTLVAIVVNAPLGALFCRTPFSGCAPFAMLPSSFDLFRNQKSACKNLTSAEPNQNRCQGRKNSKFVKREAIAKTASSPRIELLPTNHLFTDAARFASVVAICGSSLFFS